MNAPSDRVSGYFLREKKLLTVVTITGIIYNVGLVAGPWFEGQLVQVLCDILNGTKTAADMLRLALCYAAVIAGVQLLRFLKRLYVRKFGNAIGRRMKLTIYRSLLSLRNEDGQREETGTLLTKAISDAEACAEGMRKATTEVFDTGVVMVTYVVMLFVYDWRMSLIVVLIPPVAYLCAERLKTVVTRSTAEAKESAGRLNASTLEMISNTVTYRTFGQESRRRARYEEDLKDYEKRQILANIWESAMPPVYLIIAMAGTVPILWFGGRNVVGTGWTAWDIAAFSTYLACYTKLAVKASKSAKLFNAIQKAGVSWKRVLPYLKDLPEPGEECPPESGTLQASGVSFRRADKEPLFEDLSFTLRPGEILGVTGGVACGKTSLGRLFLDEGPCSGQITLSGEDLSRLWEEDRTPVGYLGHQPELFSGSIRENICMGVDGDIGPVLRCVCLDDEVAAMEQGENTVIGEGGIRLSGGQQARLALARTLYHQRPVYVLDDPFSAVDTVTEREIYRGLRALAKDSAVILISHRLTLFPEVEQVLWLNGADSRCADHQTLYAENPEYRMLCDLQRGGERHEA